MSRLGGIDTQYFTDEGDPLSYGLLYCYETGTTTPKGTFHDSDLTVPNTWPIELDAIGVPPDVFFSGTAKFVLKDSEGTTLRTLDPVIDNEFQTGDAVVYRLGDIDSQFFDQNGDILAFGKLYVYKNGTSTPKDTYSNNALSTLNDWPIVFDSVGFLGDVFFEGKASLVLTDQYGVQQRELDEVDTFDVSYLCVWTPPAVDSDVTTTQLLIADYKYEGTVAQSPDSRIFSVSGDNIIITQESVSGTGAQAVVRRSTDGGVTWEAKEPLPITSANTPENGANQYHVPGQFYYHPTDGWWIYGFYEPSRKGSRWRQVAGVWTDEPWPGVQGGGYTSNDYGFHSFTGDGDDFIFVARRGYRAGYTDFPENCLYIARRELATGDVVDIGVLDGNSNGRWPPQKMSDGSWVFMVQAQDAGLGSTGHPVIYHMDATFTTVLHRVLSSEEGNIIIDVQTDGETVFWTKSNSSAYYRYQPGGAVTTVEIPGAYGNTGGSTLHVQANAHMWLAVSCTGGASPTITAYSLDDGITWTAGPDLQHTSVVHGSSVRFRQLAGGDNGVWYYAYSEESAFLEVLEKFEYGSYAGVCW